MLTVELTVELLLRSVEEWNKARRMNPSVKPNLIGANLRKINLRMAQLYYAKLSDANLSGADLGGTNLNEADLNGADLSYAKLNGAKLRGANLCKSNLSNVDLCKADLSRADLRGANLGSANLIGADLTGADLRRTDISGVPLRGVNFSEASLCEANLRWTHLSIVDFRGANLSLADLDVANFNGADLRGANLCLADLDGANFSLADLSGANLSLADLSGANLSGANLSEADLSGANLSEADLSEADLSLADLSGADLSGANLSKATIGGTIFGKIDLSYVKYLGNVRPHGPSTIGIDTLYMSNGNIPQAFLKSCGVPDIFIDYVYSLTKQPVNISYDSCFISHSTQDKKFADLIYTYLRDNKVQCWYAPHDMKPRKKVYEQLRVAIYNNEQVLLILSENSMKSEWVKTEILTAKKREDKEGKQILFPISLVEYEKIKEWELFDSDTGRDLAKEIREYHIASFHGIKQEKTSCQNKFAEILDALQKAKT
jgi:uncharacterized protein YjbI with pentapeptide repeats